MQTQIHRLLLLLPLLIAGCSGKVEVSTETRTPSKTTEHVEKFETRVALDVLSDREDPEPPPVPEDSPAPEQPPIPPEAERKAVEVSGIANIATIVHGDLHLHEHYHEHLHVEEKPRRIKKKPEPVKVEVQRQKIDPRCERSMREHLERVARWKKMFEN